MKLTPIKVVPWKHTGFCEICRHWMEIEESDLRYRKGSFFRSEKFFVVCVGCQTPWEIDAFHIPEYVKGKYGYEKKTGR